MNKNTVNKNMVRKIWILEVFGVKQI